MKKTLWIFGIVVLSFLVVSSVTSKVMYDKSFPRFDRHDETVTSFLRYEDIEDTYEREVLDFPSDTNDLQGYLYFQEESNGLVVFAHGLGGGADSYINYAKWFLDHGWSVFMYDATGSYDSEGSTTKGFPQALIDLENALDHIRQSDTLGSLDIMLVGHSWGGYAVANALHLNEEIKSVVSIAAPSNAEDMVFEQTKSMLGVFAYTQKPFVNLYQRIRFKEYASLDAVEAINNSDASVLIIHGINDEMVQFDGSALIARKSEIDNEKTEFITRDDPSRDDHNNLMRSQAAMDYRDEMNLVYKDLFDTHDGAIPLDIQQAFYEDIDRVLAQELDEVIMNRIHSQFMEAVNVE